MAAKESAQNGMDWPVKWNISNLSGRAFVIEYLNRYQFLELKLKVARGLQFFNVLNMQIGH